MDYPEVIEYSVGEDKFKAELDYVYANGDEAIYLVYLQGGSELSWLCHCYNSYSNIQEIINKEKQMTQNTKQSTKPFNLQAALDGAPIMTTSDIDLVIVTTTKVGWVNVSKDDTNNYFSGTIYSSYEEATDKRNLYNYITTTKIEWEE